jgi:hypothetical protein
MLQKIRCPNAYHLPSDVSLGKASSTAYRREIASGSTYMSEDPGWGEKVASGAPYDPDHSHAVITDDVCRIKRDVELLPPDVGHCRHLQGRGHLFL